MQNKLINFYLSCFFIGFIPVAPGTFGSLVGVFFMHLLRQKIFFQEDFFKIIILIFLTISLSFFSILLIKFSLKNKNYDQGWIVIDEFIVIIISLSFLFLIENNYFLWVLFSFLLFRFFDILKPLGIKKIDNLNTPFAVILDDVIAGFYALGCSLLLYLII